MATTPERLAEAEAAYHDLVRGRQARVFVDQNGERIEYTPANAARLAMYIADLKRQLEQSCPGPMQVWL
jgi:hypothetical protein